MTKRLKIEKGSGNVFLDVASLPAKHKICLCVRN